MASVRARAFGEPVLPLLHRGEERSYPVFIDIDGVPLTIAGYTIWSELWWDGAARLRFTEANGGIDIIDETPASVDDPQYQVNLPEDPTPMLVDSAGDPTLPIGQLAYFKHYRMTAGGYTTTRGPFWLPVAE